MATIADDEAAADVQPAAPKRRRWLRGLLYGLLGLLLIVAAILIFLDTSPGRRFIIDQIEGLEPENGLRIRIGRIEGSIYGAMRLRDLRLEDPEGLFLEVPELEIDPQLLAYLLENRLHIDRLAAELAILHKLPALIPSDEEDQPVLPGFDIHLGELAIDQLQLAAGIAGDERALSLAGHADIRDGTLTAEARAQSLDSGERLLASIDAQPDGDAFDAELELFAPRDGIVAGLTGLERELIARISGEGGWSDWEGRAEVDSSGTRVLDADLALADGVYALDGNAATAALFDPGLITRLTAPSTRFRATGSFEEQQMVGDFALASEAALIDGTGGIDLSSGRFEGLRADIRMLQPDALVSNLSGRDVRLQLRLDGPFERAGFAYVLTAPDADFDGTGFRNLRAGGEGRISDLPFVLPVSATATQITGAGREIDEVLQDVRVDGALLITADQLVAEDLVFRTATSRGRADVIYAFASGDYAVGLDAEIDRFFVDGYGIVDVSTRSDIRPGRGGGFVINGQLRATTRRLDNGTLAGLAQGLPVIDAHFEYGPGSAVRFDNARLQSAGLTLAASGRYAADSRQLELAGQGRSAQYGAYRLRAAGNAARPAVVLDLESPLPALGLANVTVDLDPTAQGYAYRAEGGSTAGPFTSDGGIDLGAPVAVDVSRLNVADTQSAGRLTLERGGLIGALDLAGNGVDGNIRLDVVDGTQAVYADVEAADAELGGLLATTVRQGTLDLQAILTEEPRITASVSAIGVRRGGVSIARLAASAELEGLDNGEVTASIAGSRGRDFEFAANAALTPGLITVNGGGAFEGQPIEMTPVVLETGGEAVVLRESTIRYAGGAAAVSGAFGGGRTAANARLDAMPLSTIDILFPDSGFDGRATGRASYILEAGEAIPVADAELRISRLTREGFAVRSRPVNLGVNMRLAQDRLAARAIMESEGEAIMRAQVRLDQLRGIGLGEAIAAAPLFAEMRYSGPAETIWQLTGNETFSFSGPLIARADARGTLTSPVYEGSIRTENARLESALTGTVVEGITTEGTFRDARFTLPGFSGTTPGGGAVSGSAVFDLGLARGFGMDIQLQAAEAWLIRRDDIAARVTGPIAITLQAPPGTAAGSDTARPVGRIEADLEMVEGRFQLGNVAPATQVPQLNVTEVNRRLDEPVVATDPLVFTVDVDLDADNRFRVRGLGIDSEWGADLAIRGPLSGFSILGQMDLVRGDYTFAGKRFELERGRIEFYGNTPIDPTLDIVAGGGVEGIDATITIGGTGAAPEIAFASTPSLPQDELLSRLLFGESITNLSAPEAFQLGAAVASLQGGGGGALDPINTVRDAIGLDRLRIVPADPVEDHETAVAAGLYVIDDLYLEVITDGQGYSATHTEFQLTRWLSLLSTISTIGRARGSIEASIDY